MQILFIQNEKTKFSLCRPARQKWFEVKALIEKRQRAIDQHSINLALDSLMGRGGGAESPFPTPVMKPARPHLSAKEKLETKGKLMDKFPNLPERFVEWALDAAMYEVEKSERLLQEVGPQTPDEFKPFVVAASAASQQQIAKEDRHQQQQRRSEFFPHSIIFRERINVKQSSSFYLMPEHNIVKKIHAQHKKTNKLVQTIGLTFIKFNAPLKNLCLTVYLKLHATFFHFFQYSVMMK